MSEDTLSQAKAYARQIILEGEIRNYDLYTNVCIELQKKAGDIEAFELLKKLRLLDESKDNKTEDFHKHSTSGAWFLILIGILILAFGIVMYFVVNIHLVWIGGAILAITIIGSGLKLLKENSIPVRSPRVKYKAEDIENDSDYMAINCGMCFTRYHIKKGQGVITSKCPSCGRQAKVMT